MMPLADEPQLIADNELPRVKFEDTIATALSRLGQADLFLLCDDVAPRFLGMSSIIREAAPLYEDVSFRYQPVSTALGLRIVNFAWASQLPGVFPVALQVVSSEAFEASSRPDASVAIPIVDNLGRVDSWQIRGVFIPPYPLAKCPDGHLNDINRSDCEICGKSPLT